jgi:hypothetical protein
MRETPYEHRGRTMRSGHPLVSVYLSSTWEDLKAERQLLLDALDRVDGVECVGMERFGSRPKTTAQASVDLVEGSDYYILIIGKRYGSGITELEYRRARELQIKCLVYSYSGSTAAVAADEEDTRKRARFLELAKQGALMSEESSAASLAAKIVVDLTNDLRDSASPRTQALSQPPSSIALLPYLVDRSDQTREIEKIARARLTEDQPWPAVVVIPGTRTDFHLGLLKRYECFLLPMMLGESEGLPRDTWTTLAWPEPSIDTIDGRLAFVREDLNSRLGLSPDADAKVTHDALAKLGSRKGFVSYIPAARWRADDPLFIGAWVKMWRDARGQATSFPVVFLCIQFELPASGFLARFVPSPSARAERWVANLRDPDKKTPNIPGAFVVPPLTLVHVTDAMDWAQRECARRRDDLDIDYLTTDVSRMYRATPELRMDELVQPLREALVKSWATRRSMTP